PRAIAPRIVRPRATAESGLDDAANAGVPVAERIDDVTNEPVTTPAKAGWGAVFITGSPRLPFASMTACPTWAANAIAMTMTPTENRTEDSWARLMRPRLHPVSSASSTG